MEKSVCTPPAGGKDPSGGAFCILLCIYITFFFHGTQELLHPYKQDIANILGDAEYGGRISRSVSQMEHDEQNGMDPAAIGRYIAGIVEKTKPAVVYVAGAQYKFLSLLCKLLPAAARERIVGKLYG